MTKTILVFGAGKSATSLISYLVKETAARGWHLVVADMNEELARSKTGNAAHARALGLNITDTAARQELIFSSDIVVSLLPPTLHFLVAQDCLTAGRSLLTASYMDDALKAMASEIEEKGLLFLCEMGLDPGIDHMSAMKMIEEIREEGGVVKSFRSHCGGLVAPESDDNPWHYKISWNPRSIVIAGKAGALYREEGVDKKLAYEELFQTGNLVEIEEAGSLCWYPNRDSLGYMKIYGLENAHTFIRSTLRHPDFIYGWKNIVELKLTDENPVYQTDGMSLETFFGQHLEKHGFAEWVSKKLTERFNDSKNLLKNLMELMQAEETAKQQGGDIPDNIMMVDQKGELEDMSMDDIKHSAAGVVMHKMHEANLTLKQLFYLGMNDAETIINKGVCSAADVLQFCLETKLALNSSDRDMIVMMHELEYQSGNKMLRRTSTLVEKGRDSVHTAMARTVGLPLAIAAVKILDGQIKSKGLRIPVCRDIYEPVLEELEHQGVVFRDMVTVLREDRV